MAKLGNKDAVVDGVLEVIPVTGDLQVTLNCTEFTCRCPVTNQPDWATIVIEYVPGPFLVESKSMKMYLEIWREVGIFHEHLAQRMLSDFVAVLHPKECSVTVHFNTRGGIAISAVATYEEEL